MRSTEKTAKMFLEKNMKGGLSVRIITLLNQKHYLKSFVYKKDYLENFEGDEAYIVQIEPRKNSKPICSKCYKIGAVYDHQESPRLFEFVPIWGIKFYFQ